MVQFSRLRINGFKSFSERTELEIANGLNGVVGPNGCGKSNLVEALRWVMGESSAKKMRGAGMEDVIFNGTKNRTPRNLAEVSLLLDNSKRLAPAAYNNNDEIEITRRIERDRGSIFKINGKTVRARDVQMFFADSITGSNSPALVSQGRVTQIINAKPQARRVILEESAGIAGLYARRYEAELRLKGADNNLIRIEDILGSMEGRLSSLKRQARQASRYRNINSQIRQLEILLAYSEWEALETRFSNTKKTFAESESKVADKLVAVTQLTKTLNSQSADIPQLREEQAKVSALLQNKNILLQRIEDEAARLEQTTRESLEQLEQTQEDLAHENRVLADSSSLLEKLEVEYKALLAGEEGDEDRLAEKEAVRDELEEKVQLLEEQYNTLMESAAETKARKNSLHQQIEQNIKRISAIKDRKNSASEQLKYMPSSHEKRKKLEDLFKDTENEQKNLSKLSADIEKHETIIEELRSTITTKQSDYADAKQKRSELMSEIKILREFLTQDNDASSYAPVLDLIKAKEGFEKALSRALGDSLMASLDKNSPTCWILIDDAPSTPELPKGVKSITPHIDAPVAIQRALSQIGIVENKQEALSLLSTLKTGQSLVSANGDYWRWDGFCVNAEASDQNAVRLEQKNKLEKLQGRLPEIEKIEEKALNLLEGTNQKLKSKKEILRSLQTDRKETQIQLHNKRRETEQLKDQCAEIDSNRQKHEQTIELANEDIKTLEEVLKWDQERLDKLEKAEDSKKDEETDKVRESLSETRGKYQSAVTAFNIHQQEKNTRMARLHAIADERINIQNRNIRSRERIKELELRSKTLKEKQIELIEQPKNFSQDKENLLNEISNLEAERNEVTEKLSLREKEVLETNKALKEAEESLSSHKENRAGAQATLRAIEEQMLSLETSIYEQFEMKPAELRIHSSADIDNNNDDLDALRQKKEGLLRSRDNIGPVNLRADDEAQELEKEVTTLINERNDLMQAIEELRSAIQKINKEARERLITAFDHVNAHFQSLFTRLFAGGTAHLALVDSDDPLGAGLEIFAQPPGKKLQSLSLLSGGEQTLASIALIFAMFLTNPSPICVLDEIDAPLDDANVDRVCNLLEDIAGRGETRFLVISHHRMTMARMDRLYGVTMAEKGVSQLVSVDLQQSFEFLEEAA